MTQSVVHKHVLHDTSVVTTLSMSQGATVLSVGYQQRISGLVLWEIHDSDVSSKVDRSFIVVGTGVVFPGLNSDYYYIGSVQVPTGLVWHVFEQLRPNLSNPGIGTFKEAVEGMSRVREAIKQVRGGDPPVQVQGYA